eukprot:gnl/MRDRNA2_/MRDRNA2_208285_c0_seq1.p1 gnl/MRDRNA2_/MRDRNA2_208285_c0~~gnl/MRDRNA2_/MRDRNA2_208285_c0_seq1.p1  ORF type:complete len:153 (+),score=2.95 gnl/MRDRNA2_/MRDRNA2_208285_c0_seq1:37-459(+)
MNANVFELMAVVICVLDLSIVEPLSDRDTIKFMIRTPGSFGQAVMHLTAGSLFLLSALALWIFGTYGIGLGVAFVVISALAILFMYAFIRIRVIFDPTDMEDIWRSNYWMTGQDYRQLDYHEDHVWSRLADLLEKDVESP